MRQNWAFYWYQNLRKSAKNLKQSDRAPLSTIFNISLFSLLSIEQYAFIDRAGKRGL